MVRSWTKRFLRILGVLGTEQKKMLQRKTELPVIFVKSFLGREICFWKANAQVQENGGVDFV